MKKLSIFAVTVIFSLFITNNLFANYPISVGPFLGLKAGVNAAGVPEGIKNGFTLI